MQNSKPIILKLGMQHLGLKLCKMCINDDPGCTLTYFTTTSRNNMRLNGEICNKVIKWVNLASNDQIDKDLCF